MSNIFRLSTLAALSAMMIGCGGSDGGSNTSGNNTDNVISKDSELNHTWGLNYDDGAGTNYTDYIVIDEGNVVGLVSSADSSIVVGNATNNGTSVSLSLNTPDSGRIELELNKISDSMYRGTFRGTDATLIKYGNERSQEAIEGNWETEAGYAFAIDEAGHFSSTHDHSGCTVNGTIKYKANNVYLLTGQAMGCINGALDGSFSGYGSIISVFTVLDQKIGLAQLTFSHDSVSVIRDKYQPLTLTLEGGSYL